MRATFPKFTALVLLAAAVLVGLRFAQNSPLLALVQEKEQPTNAPPPPVETTDQARQLLAAAAQSLAQHPSVRARLRQHIDLLGHPLYGPGGYVQQGNRFRMELALQLSSGTRNFVQIGDGRFLWTYEEAGGQPQLSYVDLWRVKDVLDQAEPSVHPEQAELMLQGGLARLLTTLRVNFGMSLVGETLLGEVPCWVLHGRRTDALRDNAGRGLDVLSTEGLLALSPDEARAFLGKGDLMPYRIEFYKTADSRSAAPRPEPTLVVSIEVFDVQFDGPIDENELSVPADLPELDETDAYLSRFGLGESE